MHASFLDGDSRVLHMLGGRLLRTEDCRCSLRVPLLQSCWGRGKKARTEAMRRDMLNWKDCVFRAGLLLVLLSIPIGATAGGVAAAVSGNVRRGAGGITKAFSLQGSSVGDS